MNYHELGKTMRKKEWLSGKGVVDFTGCGQLL
jgi:hypothetical protein